MAKSRREFLRAGAAALAAPAAGAEAIVLASGGQSAYSICLPDGAGPVVERAGAELRRFLEEMTGARLPIRNGGALPERAVVIQPTGGGDGFTLKTEGRRLLIGGSAEAGALYGVYGLLDRLGCRWFTREVSRIPRLRTLRLAALDLAERPAFEYREPYFTEAFDADWIARNRANGALGLHGQPAAGVPLVRFYPFAHSFEMLVPPREYFASHPEYFSLIDGKRRAERSQLCLTNEAVLRIGTAQVMKWIAQHPESTVVSVSQNDWYGWCECDNCRKVEAEEGGAHSGPMLRFVNAIADRVAQRYPAKRLITLAYQYTEEPPARTRPRPNVRIWLCPIAACEAHPYTACQYNRYFMKNLEGWSRIAQGSIYVWHYATNFSHYPMPFPDFDELAADLPLYHRSGAAGVFMEGSYPPGGGGENAALRAWLVARLLWNPRLDAWREIDDFLAAVYGPAAPAMRQYLDRLHGEVRLAPRGRGRPFWIYGMPPFSDSLARDAHASFARAERAAGDEETVRRRVRQARLPIEYFELLGAKTFEVHGNSYAPADLEGLRRRFAAWVEAARSFGMTSIHEGVELNADEREFAERIKPYDAVTIEDAAARVAVVPELGGRAIRMVRKRDGAEGLRPANPGERGYPDTSGLTLVAAPDRHARFPYEVRWRVERAEAAELRLTGETAAGLRLRRTLRLDGGVLHTETEAENGGAAPLPCALASNFELNAGTVFSSASLETGGERRPLIQPGDPPSGSVVLDGSTLPPGRWTVTSASGRIGVAHGFRPGETERCQVNWRARGDNRVTVTGWTAERVLAPGERLALNASYELI